MDLFLVFISLELGLDLAPGRPCDSAARVASFGTAGAGIGLKAWNRCMAAPQTALRVFRSMNTWQSVTWTLVGLRAVHEGSCRVCTYGSIVI